MVAKGIAQLLRSILQRNRDEHNPKKYKKNTDPKTADQ